ncbi:MAG TPA: hypothetical protein VKZ70_03935 [Burkholderiaceae bacterium]|nr:hypothetical protein [Burkholderiaceae bacterium]
MTRPVPDTDPLKREAPGEGNRVPDTDVGEGGRPGGKPGIDLPAEPGRPTPEPSNPGHPGGPPEPVDPGRPPSL